MDGPSGAKVVVWYDKTRGEDCWFFEDSVVPISSEEEPAADSTIYDGKKSLSRPNV